MVLLKLDLEQALRRTSLLIHHLQLIKMLPAMNEKWINPPNELTDVYSDKFEISAPKICHEPSNGDGRKISVDNLPFC